MPPAREIAGGLGPPTSHPMKTFFRAPARPVIEDLVAAAARYKADPRADATLGRDKTLVQIYLNPSLRTRLSTEVAAKRLGMSVSTLDAGSAWAMEYGDGVRMDAGKAEHIREGAAVISQYADVIGLRTFAGLEDRAADEAEVGLSAFAKYATVPMVSLESALRHPLQSLTDLLTIREHRRSDRPKVVLTWAPHVRALPQAVANSFAEWTLASGYDLTVAAPEGFALDERFTRGATLTTDQDDALREADFVYAKNWSSTRDYGAVGRGLDHWTVTAEKMARTAGGRFMHCLPVRRNVVVADAVLDDPVRNLTIEQAGNRQWAAQAALAYLLR